MFNTISWQGYWTFLALSLTGYYLVIYLLYFRNHFTFSFQNRNRDKMLSKSESFSNQLPVSDENEAEDRLAESCVDEIAAFFEQAKRNKTGKQELIYSLQLLLRKYKSLNDSMYRETVNTVIVSQAENYCSIHLSSEEVSHVWLD